jgi:hypothetical protein
MIIRLLLCISFVVSHNDPDNLIEPIQVQTIKEEQEVYSKVVPAQIVVP